MLTAPKSALLCVGVLTKHGQNWVSTYLVYLVSDDSKLPLKATDWGVLTKLSNLVKAVTPTQPPLDEEEEQEEPESVSALREVRIRISSKCLGKLTALFRLPSWL